MIVCFLWELNGGMIMVFKLFVDSINQQLNSLPKNKKAYIQSIIKKLENQIKMQNQNQAQDEDQSKANQKTEQISILILKSTLNQSTNQLKQFNLTDKTKILNKFTIEQILAANNFYEKFNSIFKHIYEYQEKEDIKLPYLEILNIKPEEVCALCTVDFLKKYALLSWKDLVLSPWVLKAGNINNRNNLFEYKQVNILTYLLIIKTHEFKIYFCNKTNQNVKQTITELCRMLWEEEGLVTAREMINPECLGWSISSFV